MREINSLIKKYLNYCQFCKGLSLKTIKAYRIDLKQFAEYCGAEEDRMTDRNIINDYVAELQKHYKVKSTKRKMASIKAFFNYLEYDEDIEVNPFSKLHIRLNEPFVLPRIIPLKTVEMLLRSAYCEKNKYIKNEQQYRTRCRDIAVLELLFASGMRVSELCSLICNL